VKDKKCGLENVVKSIVLTETGRISSHGKYIVVDILHYFCLLLHESESLLQVFSVFCLESLSWWLSYISFISAYMI